MRTRRGLTLLEMVVTLSIILVMVVLAAQTLNGTIEMKNVLADRDAVTRSSRAAISVIRRDLQLAFLTQSQSPNTYRTVFVGIDDNPDRLYLASLSHQRLYRNSRESDQTEITLWAESERGTGYTLYHREAPHIDEEPDKDGTIFPLAYNLASLNLRYLDSRTNEWLDEWDSRSGNTAGRLPRAVQIGLVLHSEDPDDPLRTLEVPSLTTVILEYADPLKRMVR